MNEVLDILKEFKNEFRNSPKSFDDLVTTHSKLSLYIDRFFPDARYKDQLKGISTNPESQHELNESVSKTYALIDTLIEDAVINKNLKVLSLKEYEEVIKLKETNERLLIQLENSRATLSEEKEKQKGFKAKLDLAQTESKMNEDELKKQLNNAREEISQLKETKQKNEIAKNSLNFQKQANANKLIAQRWMWAVIASIALFVCLLLIGFLANDDLFDVVLKVQNNSKGLDANLVNKLAYIEIGKKLASRLLVFSMIIYLISFFVKNYNAQMHNYVVNSHKSNALSSTVDLIGTAKLDDGNDKILAQATQAIFTTQRSGYQGAESEPASPNLITNVIDAVIPKK